MVVYVYSYRGEVGERIPEEATHITVAEDVIFVRPLAFAHHPNIVEVICHDKVILIGQMAFICCPSLRRVVMPGVKVVEMAAFDECKALADVKFGRELGKIKHGAFGGCKTLERIALPLKDRIITHDDTFQGCVRLKHIDIVGGVHETIAALLLEGWRNDVNKEIYSINKILPRRIFGIVHPNGKARIIQRWIRAVLRKIIRYQAEHRRLLEEDVAATLMLGLPHDIVMNNVLPFLALTPYTSAVAEGDGDGGNVGRFSFISSILDLLNAIPVWVTFLTTFNVQSTLPSSLKWVLSDGVLLCFIVSYMIKSLLQDTRAYFILKSHAEN